MDKKEKKHKDKNKKRPFWVPLAIALVLLMIASCLFTYSFILADYDAEKNKGEISIAEEGRKEFYIKKGESTTSISERLKEEGYIDNVTFFKVISKIEGYDGTYKSGTHYLSEKHLEMRDIMKILSSQTETIKVTFPEGFTIIKMAKRLEEYKICTAQEFKDAVNNIYKDKTVEANKDRENGELFLEKYENILPSVSELDKKDFAMEGYLFPDTYFFDLNATPEEIIEIMLNNFENRYLPIFKEKAEELDLTMDEVIKLASLVERECRVKSERREIAGVFYNRLKQPAHESLEAMESCATIYYIYEKRGLPEPEIITSKETGIEDEYNTYIHKGLPPGPICNPGVESITAVLNPKGQKENEPKYYFFVLDTRNDQRNHLFGKTLAEHEKNIKDIERG